MKTFITNLHILLLCIILVDSNEVINSSISTSFITTSFITTSSVYDTFELGYKLITKRPDSMPSPPKIECGDGTLRSSPMTGRIIDAILFNNEWDIIETRFYEYNEVVDYFIVYEDEVTFTGAPKRRTFPQLMEERLQGFKNKTIYADGSKTRQRCIDNNAAAARNPDINGRSRNAAFDCEIISRNSLIHYIPGGVQPEDFILMSDSDQIIDEQYLRSLRWCQFPGKCIGFNLPTSHYSLHWPSVRHVVGRSACSGSHMKVNPSMEDLHMCREGRGTIAANSNHGWHLSYFGSPQFIRVKLMSYAETQTNTPPYNQISYITDHAYRGKELLERDVLELNYRDFKSLSAPWFALANLEHRQSFIRYSREDDKGSVTERKYIKRCLILKSVSGGLGNQLFAIANIVARSNYLGIPYSLPVEKGTAGTYWETSLLERILVDAFDRRDCAPVNSLTSTELGQFSGIPELLPGVFEPVPANITMENSTSGYYSVEIHGMLQDTRDILRSKSIIRNRLVSSIVQNDFHRLYPGRNLMISCYFYQKELLERGTPWTYYEQAIHQVLRKDHTIHLFGASGIGKFAEKVLNMTADQKQKIVIHEGHIDNNAQTAKHLEHILHCDDFILYASSVALWGALLTNVQDSIITYPLLGKDNMIEKMKLDKWIGIKV